MKKTLISLSLIFMILAVNLSYACTTAVISGKHTPDGRPLLWKLRDTEAYNNKLVYFNTGRYDFIGLVNSADTLRENVWAGTNSAGFAIMNSASFNLNGKDRPALRDQEGIIMKKALQECATVEDFEKMLKHLPKPWGLEANFGIIDAQGGAMYFETSNTGYTKFDANNPAQAPNGYIIRSNYSYTGTPNVGYGFIRFQTAQELFYQAAGRNDLSLDFLLDEVSRSQYNALTKADYRKQDLCPENNDKYVVNKDCITRYSTTSSMVIQGVKDKENALLTTLWTQLGNPLTTLSIPVILNENQSLPAVLSAPGIENAPLCDYSLKLKEQLYPITRGSGTDYININKAFTTQNNGITQVLLQEEQTIAEQWQTQINEWRIKGFHQEELQNFYQKVDEFTQDVYHAYFEL